MHFSPRVYYGGRIRLRAHFAGPNRMVVMQIVTPDISGSLVINGRQNFLSNQFRQRRLAGIVTHQLDPIPEDGKVTPIRVAEISSVDLEGREGIGTRQSHAAA